MWEHVNNIISNELDRIIFGRLEEFGHYLLIDDFAIPEKRIPLRRVGCTVGEIEIDDDFRVISIVFNKGKHFELYENLSEKFTKKYKGYRLNLDDVIKKEAK